MSSIRLPHTIDAALRQVSRRSRLLATAHGLLVTGAALLVATLIAIGVDSLIVLFDPRARVVLTMIALASAGVVFLMACLRPLLRPRARSSVARQVEQHAPSLEERWSTVTELAESSDPPIILGSSRLIQRVTDEAVEMRSAVRPEQIANSRLLRRPAAVLAGVFLAFVLVWAAWPTQTRILLRRFWSPTTPISLTQLTCTTGSRVIPRGEPIRLEAKVEGRLPAVGTLLIRGAEGQQTVDLRTSEPAQTLSHEIRAVEASFAYSFRAGDGQTSWQRVTAADRPSIASAHYRITPPGYSRLPIEEKDSLPSRVRALQGSLLELRIAPTKALARLDLKYEDGRLESLVPNGKEYVLQRTLERSFAFSITLTDDLGLTNVSPPSCRFSVYEDRPPTVKITAPSREIAVRPDEKLPIEFEARDDLGVAAAELVVMTGEGANEKPVQITPIPLEKMEGSKQVRAHVDLDLNPLKLEQGARLSYAIRVFDTKQASARGERQADVDATSRPSRLAQADGAGTQPAGAAQQAAADTQPSGTQAQSADAATQPSLAGAERPSSSQPANNQANASDTNQSQPADTAGAQSRQKPSQNQDAGGGGQAKSEPKKKGDTQPSEADASTRPSSPSMTMRQLPGQSAESPKQNLQVDKWADKFDGQVREKLQIAIDSYLARLDAALAIAQTQTELLRKPTATAPAEQPPALAKARSALADADRTVSELRSKSDGTPYAFIGLQLHNIREEHVVPAEGHLSDVTTRPAADAASPKDIEQAWYHIVRAREQLADLTKKYEEIKRDQKIADAAERVSKMHRIFIEDMLALLEGADKPTLNRRKNKMVEVPDEFADALKEFLEQLKKTQADLAKALADDPQALRRFLDKAQNTNLRDQLTRLHWRQEDVQKQSMIATTRPAEGGAAITHDFLIALGRQQQELAEAVSRSFEKMITWMPKDAGPAQGSLAKALGETGEAARLLHECAIAAAAQQLDRAIELATRTVQHLESAHTSILGVTVPPTTNPAPGAIQQQAELPLFIAHRTAELEHLTLEENAVIQKMQALLLKRAGRALGLEQVQIKLATMDLAERVARILPQIAQMSPPATKLLKEVTELLNGPIPESQQEASIALRSQRWDLGAKQAGKAIDGFVRAEQLYDEALTLIEKFLAEMAAKNPPQVGQPPSLEQLLEGLKREMENADKLGHARPRLNVQILSDWAGNGEDGAGGKGKDAEGGNNPPRDEKEREARNAAARARAEAARREAQKVEQQAQKTQKEAARKHDRNLAEAKKRAESQPAGKGGGGKSSVGGQAANERDFNVFVSTLENDVTQGRGTNPPAQYREAIESYFETISAAASQDNK